MKKLYVVGIGPGEYDMMTGRAIAALQSADVIVGYQVYTELVKEYFPGKEIMTTPMRQEVERCRMAVREAAQGRVVAMISSGDAGIYGMAGLMYEVLEEEGLLEQIELEIVAGVTAANAGAAWLGAPLMHDFAVICLYNPSSHKRKDYLQKACDILLEELPPQQICGYVENIDREGTCTKVCTLAELRNTTVNMFTTVYIGNSRTRQIGNKMVTPRGYRL